MSNPPLAHRNIKQKDEKLPELKPTPAVTSENDLPLWLRSMEYRITSAMQSYSSAGYERVNEHRFCFLS